MAINKNSTGYILTFAIILVSATALILSSLYVALKPIQTANVENEKRTFILKAAGLTDADFEGKTKQQIEELFNSKITSVVLDYNGVEMEGEDAFSIDPVKEFKSTKGQPEKRRYPLFIFEGGKKNVIPMAGQGLWGPVWAYAALAEDQNTIAGIIFEHKSETPGLGAEITKPWFQDQFSDGTKTIMGDDGKYKSVAVVKGGVKNPNHQVDAIAGSTITSKGVSEMMEKGFKAYMKYWGKLKSDATASNN
jgi:Na+-transporting NADH:ubiquinone oxidoreductase subunit C